MHTAGRLCYTTSGLRQPSNLQEKIPSRLSFQRSNKSTWVAASPVGKPTALSVVFSRAIQNGFPTVGLCKPSQREQTEYTRYHCRFLEQARVSGAYHFGRNMHQSEKFPSRTEGYIRLSCRLLSSIHSCWRKNLVNIYHNIFLTWNLHLPQDHA